MRADLKDERDVVFVIGSGRLFHNIGAEKGNARSTYVTEFTVGTVKSSLEDERRLRCGWYNQSSLTIYNLQPLLIFFNWTKALL